MSIQSARDFLDRVESDKEFRKRLGDCTTTAEQQQFAREAGFEFTSEELGVVRGELQDADLDMISGGGCSCACENQACQSIET